MFRTTAQRTWTKAMTLTVFCMAVLHHGRSVAGRCLREPIADFCQYRDMNKAIERPTSVLEHTRQVALKKEIVPSTETCENDKSFSPLDFTERVSTYQLQFQSKDLGLSEKDVSLHSPLMAHIREAPFANWRQPSAKSVSSRSLQKLNWKNKEKTGKGNPES